VHCTVEGDSKTGNSIDDVLRGLDRAKERGEVLELLIHKPGTSMSWDDFDTVLAGVEDRGLAWVTYEDMAHGIAPVAGVSLQYDGTWLDSWMDARPYLAKHHARATIFITRYQTLHDDERALVRTLSDDGNDIEPHGVNHLRGPVMVEEEGLQTYLDDEVQPSIDNLRNDGYEVVSFAYPFGDRTDEIDHAVLERVQLVRSLTITKPLVTSPCPY
jgi:peptidoglycan/xylan/chitin deacetylase (PgdA/CDA1 family)